MSSYYAVWKFNTLMQYSLRWYQNTMLHKVILCRAIERFNEYSYSGNMPWEDINSWCYTMSSSTKLWTFNTFKNYFWVSINTQYEDVTLCQEITRYPHSTHWNYVLWEQKISKHYVKLCQTFLRYEHSTQQQYAMRRYQHTILHFVKLLPEYGINTQHSETIFYEKI